ncbi:MULTISPECIES: hypothetical protein [Bacillus]|uniref:Uncharacterized protein n=2 Tax=Bacillus TaxID=1386 RepID=A0A0M3RAX9_9BACI|nr:MULTISPECIES: hypothetical protein [Bacillus]ALC83932.1 hypothetical protein AM592_22350 [Bacillus gobiensis]MBP1082998.1 ribosomal protein L21E [Bacillus capparidis]MED1098028.1 hypothetical protein [Bacillus capparidis]
MKKLFVAGIVACLTLSINIEFPQSTKAASENKLKADISNDEQKWLEGLGFTSDEIVNMSKEDLEHTSKRFKGKKGKIIAKQEEYFKVDNYIDENGKQQKKMIKSTKDEALKEVEKLKKQKENKHGLINFNNASAASDTENDGWITQTTTVSDIGSTYLAKTSYKWLSNPDIGFSDTIAITHGDNVDKIAGSEYARHWYKDGIGTHYLPADYSADTKNYYGYADKFDLKKVGTNHPPYDHQGYFYFEFNRDKTSDNTADLYGHYAHALTSPYYSVSLSLGAISLSGSAASNATDTHVDWTY